MPVINAITGTVTHIGDIKTFGGKFEKRSFWLKYKIQEDKDWTEEIEFDLTKSGENYDKLHLLEDANVVVGSVITVKFDVTGRLSQKTDKYPARVFNSLKAWGIELDEQGGEAPPSQFSEPAPQSEVFTDPDVVALDKPATPSTLPFPKDQVEEEIDEIPF